ncbi:unnamed protein product [Symbiodinium microadriaticum]|nr:unnamed protein product [Symbiodinium microadriaticum]CAE7933953.1 unnamed protein product [Symbiodinium sp. KB8]
MACRTAAGTSQNRHLRTCDALQVRVGGTRAWESGGPGRAGELQKPWLALHGPETSGSQGKDVAEKEEATIITSIIACCSACWRVTKEYAIYPVKQSIVDTFDSIQESLFPYKQGVKVPYSYTEADGSLLSLFTDDWRVIGLTEACGLLPIALKMDDWLTDRAPAVSRPSVNTRNEQSSESDVSDVKVLAPKLLQRPKAEEGMERSDEKATTPAPKTLKQKEEEYAAARARIFGDTTERGGRGRGRGRGQPRQPPPNNDRSRLRGTDADDPDYDRNPHRYAPRLAPAETSVQSSRYAVTTYEAEFPSL